MRPVARCPGLPHYTRAFLCTCHLVSTRNNSCAPAHCGRRLPSRFTPRRRLQIHNNGDAQPYTASPRSVHTSASQAVDSEVLPDTFAEAKPARRVATALENMALADPPPPLAGGFVLVNERVVGGQAIVNFARGDRVGTYDQYAVKFFLQKKDFEREVRLYKDAELRRAMPRLFAAVANRGGEWRSRGGLVLPPHIVLERGVTLRDWSREARKYGELLNLFEQVRSAGWRGVAVHVCDGFHRALQTLHQTR